MKILAGTDVLIDVALARGRHAVPAGELLDQLEIRAAKGFMAWHSASHFCALVSPKTDMGDARAFLRDLIRFIDIAPASTRAMRCAVGLNLRDFEAAMQVAAALACSADVIATRNTRDYKKAPVRAATPAMIVNELASSRR